MIRVIHIVSALDSGGVESMLLNYYKNMNKSEITFDFISHDSKVGLIEKEFLKMGSKIFHVIPKKKNIFKNTIQIYNILKKGKYNIIHCHQNFSEGIPLYIAKILKIDKRIAHAHGSQDNIINTNKLYNKILRVIILRNANCFFACSNKAGKYLFGDKKKFIIIRNAIDFTQFIYSENERNNIRKKYNIDNDEIVIGNIGRFCIHKNQKFLIELFCKVNQQRDNVKIMLIGEGELKDELEDLIEKYKLNNKVLIISKTNELYKYYSAMDLFIFPSISEGFGMALIEAQANGLQCIASENVIPQETKITNNLLNFISLQSSKDIWIDKINYAIEKLYTRKDKVEFIDNKFDVKNNIKKLEDLYKQLYKGEINE